MTYIVAGKYEDTTFIMADSICRNAEYNTKTFQNKIIKSQASANCFFSIVGNKFLFRSLVALDLRLAQNVNKYDFFKGKNWINKLVEIFQIDLLHSSQTIKHVPNRLYFVDPDTVIYHDLEFNSDNSVKNYSGPRELSNGEYIDSFLNCFEENIELLDNESLEDFSKRHLKEMSNNENLKERFSYVQISKMELVVKRPYRYLSDIFAEWDGKDIDQLDTDCWDLRS